MDRQEFIEAFLNAGSDVTFLVFEILTEGQLLHELPETHRNNDHINRMQDSGDLFL